MLFEPTQCPRGCTWLGDCPVHRWGQYDKGHGRLDWLMRQRPFSDYDQDYFSDYDYDYDDDEPLIPRKT